MEKETKDETECLKEWQKHIIKYTHGDGIQLCQPKTWCGAIVSQSDWTFLDAQHAALSVRTSRLQPCPNCANEIVKLLSVSGEINDNGK